MRKKLCSIITCFVCLAAQTRCENRATVPIHGPLEGWWGNRHRAILETVASGDIELVFLGDSITAGWSKDLLDKYWGKYKYANLGIPADRTEHVLWRLAHGEVNGIKPRLVILMIGTNNLKSGNVRMRPREVADGVKTVIAELRKRLPGTRILLCAILPRSSAHRVVFDAVREANTYLPELARIPGVYYTDFGDLFLDGKGNVNNRLMPDSLHPNAKGYAIWASHTEHLVDVLMGKGAVGARYDGSGLFPALPPVKWSRHTNTRFRTKLPGKGCGSPVVFDEKIYLVTQPASLVCVSAIDGSILWQASPDPNFVGPQKESELSPIVTAEHVYAVLPNRDVVCYTHEGKPVWRRRLLEGGAEPIFGLTFEDGAVPPTVPVVDGKRYAALDSGVLAVHDAESGELLHKKKLPGDMKDREIRSIFATARHVYLRCKGNPALTVVLTNDEQLNEIWRYSVTDASRYDAFENHAHFIRAGDTLICKSGRDPAPPEAPPELHTPAPLPDDADTPPYPVTDYVDDTSLVRWAQVEIKGDPQEAQDQDWAPVPAKSLWTNEVYTAGRPAIDLSRAYDANRKISARFRMILNNDRKRLVRFRFFTPNGETWHWASRLSGTMRIGGKRVGPADVIELRPGRYLVQLDVKRGRTGGKRRAWMGPHFVEGDYLPELEEARKAWQRADAQWKKHQQSAETLLK